MKQKLFLAFVAFGFTLTVNAQKPFKDIGKDDEVEVLTVSNGRYVEYFTNDTLRRIGSVMFNTVTNKVEYFIPQNDIAWRAELDRAKEVSRFMSVDPLAHQYPMLCPYSFVANNPISFVDHDGQSIRPTNSVAKTTLTATFDKVFESFPELREHIQYQPIGKNDAGEAVNAFVYAEVINEGKEGETTLNVAKARRIIEKSKLSTKEKLVALAFINGLANKEKVFEFQQPMMKEKDENYGIQLGAKVVAKPLSAQLIEKGKLKEAQEALKAETGGNTGFSETKLSGKDKASNGINTTTAVSLTDLAENVTIEQVKTSVIHAVNGSAFYEPTNKKGEAEANGKYEVKHEMDEKGNVTHSEPKKQK